PTHPRGAVKMLQSTSRERLRLDEDRRQELTSRIKCVRLLRRNDGRLVAGPVLQRNLKSHAARREGQRDLNGVMRMEARRFTGKTDPEAAASPEQDAAGCGGLHVGSR